ncbi:MAG: HNH endonuclease [Arthrobacter sp.]|jgi:putative restriction endonuclease|nr:HNH endonuclease [Arthrobacter sp.]
MFRVVAPIQVLEWLPERQQVVLAPGSLGRTLLEDREHKLDAELVFRQYLIRETKVRVHQPYFRSLILRAYENRCAICSLGHAELLDAAHIIPDSEDGEPIVTNGLALCKIHHAAYDRRFIGVDGDYKVHVRQSLLDEVDGPMLRHGLQEMHGQPLRALPTSKLERPSRDALDVTFARFLAHG